MPASLINAKIRGLRSYSPWEVKTQTIDFMPLTLIVGRNGTGKTTIIEALKFMISGEEPPLSDSRRNFIHTPKKLPTSTKEENEAAVELEFVNFRNEKCIARRTISRLSLNKSQTPSVSSSYKVGRGIWNHIHKQDEWGKTIPRLFSIPNQTILNNVVLCHQEENLWCLGDSGSVKQVFDRIFSCDRYKKELRHIDVEMKTCKTELSLHEKDLIREGDSLKRMNELNAKLSDLRSELENITSEANDLDGKLLIVSKSKEIIEKQVEKSEGVLRELDGLNSKMKDLQSTKTQLERSIKNPSKLTDEELQLMVEKHRKMVDDNKLKQARLQSKEESYRVDIAKLERQWNSAQHDFNRLRVIEMKNRETHDNLMRIVGRIKIEQSLENLNSRELAECLEVLEKFEHELLEEKSTQSELEDRYSTKQSKLNRDIADLAGQYQGIIHDISSKENYIKNLNRQLEQADPIAKDLVGVRDNLTKMSSIATDLPSLRQVTVLSGLITESSQTVDKVITRVRTETLDRLTRDIAKENEEIQNNRNLLKELDNRKEILEKERLTTEQKHNEVRIASKDAHNRLVVFKNDRKAFTLTYNTFIEEKTALESTNLDEKRREINYMDEQIKFKRAQLNEMSLERTQLADLLSLSYEENEEYLQNIQLRALIKQIEDLSSNISQLERSTVSSAEFAQLKTQLSDLNREGLEYRDRRSAIIGTQQQLEKDLKTIELELKRYIDTESNYAKILGRTVCNRIVIKDLEKLKECFSQSIINFHEQMLIRINQALRIKWRQIYKGSDIDQIELVDEEVIRGKDKKISYYLAMRKGGVRMKMREKSSAGQKALASIIVRMVLAELFVRDFAFIALDEPTANLDAANVVSLAEAIAGYVRKRMNNNSTIQWIIITHDEHFLRALDEKCSPFFYRIEMDEEGYSRINKIAYEDIQPASQNWELQ